MPRPKNVPPKQKIPGVGASANPRLDMVNSPPHYTQGGIEFIDALRACMTTEEFRGFLKGNAIKYLWRECAKGGKEDQLKAQWYLNRLISVPDRNEND